MYGQKKRRMRPSVAYFCLRDWTAFDARDMSETSIIASPHDLTPSYRGVHASVDQVLVATTEDKLLLCLQRHESALRHTRADFLRPLPAAGTMLLTFQTATFHDWLGVDKHTWQGVLATALVAVGIWFVISVYHSITRVTIDHVVSEIKAGAEVTPIPSRVASTANSAARWILRRENPTDVIDTRELISTSSTATSVAPEAPAASESNNQTKI